MKISVKDARPVRTASSEKIVTLNKKKMEHLIKTALKGHYAGKSTKIYYGAKPTFKWEEFDEYLDYIDGLCYKHNKYYEVGKYDSKLPPATRDESIKLVTSTFNKFTSAIDDADSKFDKLLTYLNETPKREWPIDFDEVFNKASNIINHILSLVPYSKEQSFYFGSGVSRASGSYQRTFQGRLSKLNHITTGDCEVLDAFFTSELADAIRSNIKVHISNSDDIDLLCQVPKNSKTNRVITITSTLQKAEQRVIGNWLRKCFRALRRPMHSDTLCSVNHDLDTCSRDHQVLAWMSSITHMYDTYDFSSASDRLTLRLINHILELGDRPFNKKLNSLLKLCSSNRYVMKTFNDKSEIIETIHQYKSYPMGYAFTFELETIFFYAITTAFLSSWGFSLNEPPLGKLAFDVSVYGDDLIVPYNRPKVSFERFFNLLGFQLNAEKSFSIESTFRESCGADFNNGSFVRSFYCKQRNPSIDEFLRITNYVKLNYHISDVELAQSSFYRKVFKDFKLYQARASIDDLVGRNSIFTKDVPTSLLLVDKPNIKPKVLLECVVSFSEPRWICGPHSDGDFGIVLSTIDDYPSDKPKLDTNTERTTYTVSNQKSVLVIKAVTQSNDGFIMKLSEEWVDDLWEKYDPSLTLLDYIA